MKNIYYVGMPKCASTWLYTQLFEYSRNGFVVLRDIHFFDLYYNNGMSWYAQSFGSEYIARADITHDYILYEKALVRINSYDKNAYIIYHYRDPFELINSLYAETKRFGFEYFVEHGLSKPRNKSDFINSPLVMNILSYSIHINHLYRYFKPDQLSIANIESIRKDGRSYLSHISNNSGFELDLSEYKEAAIRPSKFMQNNLFKILLPKFGKISRLLRQHGFSHAKYIARVKQFTAKKELNICQKENNPNKVSSQFEALFSRDEVHALFQDLNYCTFQEFEYKVEKIKFNGKYNL